MAFLLALASAGAGALLPPFASAMIATSVLRDVIRAASPQIARCAGDTALEARGRVVVAFVIGPEGRVHEAEATRNETGSPELAACVVRVVLGLVFPENPRGGTIRVTYPFRFEPAAMPP